MKEQLHAANSRADGALLVAVSFLILGVAPLIGFNLFADTFDEVFSPRPVTAQQAVESPVEIATARLATESQCLAQAMYHEARGEGLEGQLAVAEVVLERTRNINYGNTVCAVVYEGIEPGRLDCQFSFACDGSMDRPKEEPIWRETRLLAEKIMTGQVKLADKTQRAIAYHSVDVKPFWSGNMIKTVQIGNHVFYRFAPKNAAAVQPAAPKVQRVSTQAVDRPKVRFPKL